MTSGLLWFDNSDQSLKDKIEKAAKRYKEKYGISPDTVFVNPNDYVTVEIEGISVEPKRTILSNHLWLGRSDGVTIQKNETFTLIGSETEE